MTDAERFRLLYGPYQPPHCCIGGKLCCALRGTMVVLRMSEGRIPWPQTLIRSNWVYILYGSLVRAVQRESAMAVSYWWGVAAATVSTWRKALGVEEYNDGTRQLHRRWASEKLPPDAQARGFAKTLTPAARKKRSESHKRRGTIPPAAGRLWTPEEEALLGKLPDTEVARRTGRTLVAIKERKKRVRRDSIPENEDRKRTGRW